MNEQYKYNRKTYAEHFEVAELVKCPRCLARRGRPCKTRNGYHAQLPHRPRYHDGETYVMGIKIAGRILPDINKARRALQLSKG